MKRVLIVAVIVLALAGCGASSGGNEGGIPNKSDAEICRVEGRSFRSAVDAARAVYGQHPTSAQVKPFLAGPGRYWTIKDGRAERTKDADGVC